MIANIVDFLLVQRKCHEEYFVELACVSTGWKQKNRTADWHSFVKLPVTCAKLCWYD